MEIRFNNSIITGKRVDLKFYFPESLFLLMRITENKEFVDSAYTDKVIGYTYECVDTFDFRRIKVKIEGQKKPLMTNEALQEKRMSEKNVAVEFINATIMQYVNDKKQSLEDSFKADDVRLVTEE